MKTGLTFFLLTSAAVLAAAPEISQARRPDLTGHVFTQGGSPLENATIFIYTAGPKEGRGTL